MCQRSCSGLIQKRRSSSISERNRALKKISISYLLHACLLTIGEGEHRSSRTLFVQQHLFDLNLIDGQRNEVVFVDIDSDLLLWQYFDVKDYEYDENQVLAVGVQKDGVFVFTVFNPVE